MTVTLKQAESALPLKEARVQIPGRPSMDTMRRWVHKGVRGGVKLKAFRVGGELFTTPAFIEEFLNEQNGDATAPRRSASAESRLEKLGI